MQSTRPIFLKALSNESILIKNKMFQLNMICEIIVLQPVVFTPTLIGSFGGAVVGSVVTGALVSAYLKNKKEKRD